MKKHFEHHISKKLITEEELQKRVKEIGKKITEDFKDREEDLVMVGLLKGSIMFMSDLLKEIKLPIIVDFMEISSYGNATESSRDVRILKDLEGNILGKDILVVEDIIDSGLTLKKVLKILGGRGPKSVSLCTLLDKKERREANIDVQYIGFEIPDEFVVGYGMDYVQEYRNLPYIGVVELKGENE